MLYNHYKAYKEFKEMWKQLRKDYKEAGMSDEAIEKIYQYDLYVFNRDRAFIEHMYPQPLNTGVDEDILVFCGVMDITVQESSLYSRLWWIEEIENPMLATFIKSLSRKDIELVTMAYFEGYSQEEIGKKLGISQQAVSKRLDKFEAIKESIKNF